MARSEREKLWIVQAFTQPASASLWAGLRLEIRFDHPAVRLFDLRGYAGHDAQIGRAR